MKKIFMALMLCLVSICIYPDKISSHWIHIDGERVEIAYYNGVIYSVFIPNGDNSTYLTEEDARNWYDEKRKALIENFYEGINVNYRVIPVDTNIVYSSFYALDKNIINENDSVEKVVVDGEVRFLYNQFYYTPILRTHEGSQYWYFMVHFKEL